MNQITPTHPSRVAIVDDDRASRESICLVIQSAGYETVAFESGEELFDQGGLDGSGCLVTDYRLPGLSGLDIQQRLAEENIAIPVILISGFADVAIAVKAMDDVGIPNPDARLNDFPHQFSGGMRQRVRGRVGPRVQGGGAHTA